MKVPDEQGLEEVRLLHDDHSQVLELGDVPEEGEGVWGGGEGI